MTGTPLLSIIIPIFNARGYLERCLHSVQNQGFQEGELEIICIDDGSTDGSGPWLDLYAEGHSNVKVFHKENGGECSARNKGLEAMSGKYFEFVDADDALISRSIRDIVLKMDKEKCDVAQFEYSMSDPRTQAELSICIAPMTLTGSVWRYVFSNEAFGHLRFDETLYIAGDTFFVQTVALNSPRCLHTSRVAYIYNNDNPNSVMAKRSFSDAAENMMRLAENHKQYLDENTFPAKRKRIETWCARATAGYIFYCLRMGKNDSPLEMLKEKGLWPYKIEWQLLKLHFKKNGGIKQTFSNYCLFIVGFRPVWWVFRTSGILKNR